MAGITRRRFLGTLGLATAGAGVAVRAFAGRPAGAPGARTGLVAGQWAMIVDTARCPEGCRICADECHRVHNVPGFEDPRREVKWLWIERWGDVFPDQAHERVGKDLRERGVPVLCNHCARPSCVRVCPTGATWRRESDGIVMMDMHRCIGCRFCMAACPYGARSFNWVDPRKGLARIDPGYPTRTIGVVEKCDLCVERLARGERPACEAACPERAIYLGDVASPGSVAGRILAERYNVRRRPDLGNEPQVYYLP